MHICMLDCNELSERDNMKREEMIDGNLGREREQTTPTLGIRHVFLSGANHPSFFARARSIASVVRRHSITPNGRTRTDGRA